jgi:hypothetical protein
MRTIHKDLQDKLAAATSEKKLAQDGLARISAEKAILLKDHQEMKSVCEELMAMVEGGQYQKLNARKLVGDAMPQHVS